MDEAICDFDTCKAIPKKVGLYNSSHLWNYEKNPFFPKISPEIAKKGTNETKIKTLIKSLFKNPGDIYKYVKEKNQDLIFKEDDDNENTSVKLMKNSTNCDNRSLNSIQNSSNPKSCKFNQAICRAHSVKPQNLIIKWGRNISMNKNKSNEFNPKKEVNNELLETPKIKELMHPKINLKEIATKNFHFLHKDIRLCTNSAKGELLSKNQRFKFLIEENQQIKDAFQEVVDFIRLSLNNFTNSQVTYNGSMIENANLPSFPDVLSNKSLVLDLDETLIHLMNQPNDPHIVSLHFDIFNLKLRRKNYYITNNMEIIIRPFAREFLKEISKYYEIIVS